MNKLRFLISNWIGKQMADILITKQNYKENKDA